MGKHEWTDKEIEFLKNEYPSNNRQYCIDKLGISLEEIVYKIRKLKLKKNKSLKYNEFDKIISPYTTYVLGFMWADGHIKNDGRHFNVGGVKEDIDEIEHIFKHLGNWGVSIQDRSKHGWRTAKYLIGSNKEIYSYLIEHDYGIKSQASADKILSKIPDDLKHYFFRGLIDGDGSFYYKDNGRQFALTSSYYQDWSYFEKLCESLEIKYSIRRVKNINKKTGNENKSSVIRILGKEITKLGDYLYQGENFGLKRKLLKYKQIKESYEYNKLN
jgi:hypothetical protein